LTTFPVAAIIPQFVLAVAPALTPYGKERILWVFGAQQLS
jgi:hypothetical protein